MPLINVSKKIENAKFNKAIIFVHGLNGSSKTWQGENDRFVDILQSEQAVFDNFGMFIFEYHTKIVEIGVLKKVIALIPINRNTRFNVGIRRIAMELKSTITNLLEDYKSIVLVVHSMGGLVAKRAITEMNENDLKRIKFVLSLSVPHFGANLANIGSNLLGHNPQLADLKIMSEFTTDLSNRFSNLSIQPKFIYQAGIADQVVPEACAIPQGILSENRLDTANNHYDVLTIPNKDIHLPLKRLIRELNEILFLENQMNISNSRAIEASFFIPENSTFKQIADALVKKSNSTIEYFYFSEQELQIPLLSQTIIKSNTTQALESLYFIGIYKIPKYEVEFEGNNFKIKKIV